MCEAKVMFDYDAEADDELTLKEGDQIKNIVKKEDGWWEGELMGRRGMFPENFVDEIKSAASVEKQKVAKVTFDYDAENEDELTLKEGELVKVIEQEEEGWWKGELNGKIGVFPTNFVELMKSPVASPDSSQPAKPEPSTSVEDKVAPEKKTAKSLGGVGFGGLFTQNDLSGIKLKKRESNGKVPPKQEKPEEEPSELNKLLSNKRNPPEIPQPARPASQPPRPASQPPRPASQPPRPAKITKYVGKAIVEYDYEGEQSDELTLKKNDIINILDKNVADGWCKGELQGKIGLFPDNFVRLLPEEPKKESDNAKDNEPAAEMPIKLPPARNDVVDNKPGRPDLPFPKLKPTTEHRPPLPVSKPGDEKPKKPVESKPVQEEKVLPPEKPPSKKSPPLLPKKPGKPKPEPKVELRNRNGPNVDPSKRFSEMPPRSDVQHDKQLKRHSSGPELPLNLNDIKSGSVLQPLTSDRPKHPSKNLPTKYDQKKKPSTPEKLNDVEWAENIPPVTKHQYTEKPKKPAAPETAKPTIAVTPKPILTESAKTNEVTVSAGILQKLQDDINSLKTSLDTLSKEYKEHIHKCESNFRGMEKRLTSEVDDLTKELDEEKKARSALDVEVNRLRKLVKQMAS